MGRDITVRNFGPVVLAAAEVRSMGREVAESSPTISKRLLALAEHLETIAAGANEADED